MLEAIRGTTCDLAPRHGIQTMIRQVTRTIASRVFGTRFGQAMLRLGLRATQYRVFSPRTTKLMAFDLDRLRARSKHPPADARLSAPSDRLHVGCGERRVPGWLNVDVISSDYDVDLASDLPWRNAQFSAIVSQQVIEHLELESELLPLLRELRRVSKPNAEIWLACPDLERVCRSYDEDKGQGLIDDRFSRPHGDPGARDVPPQHAINFWFHQAGEHLNLLDFGLLNWALLRTGFVDCQRVTESDFLRRFPEFPPRNDDRYCLYVKSAAG
jgi:predicted SAM-dependent methyltransferase